jgi:hypothetical protein
MRLRLRRDTGLAAENPVDRCRAEDRVVGMANHTTLVSRRWRRNWPSRIPPRPSATGMGKLAGVVMVFHDVTDKRSHDPGNGLATGP